MTILLLLGAALPACNDQSDMPKYPGDEVESVHAFDSDKSMHDAAHEGNIQILEQLLEKGSNIDQQDKLGFTPLFWGIIAGQKESCSFLTANGADVNITARDRMAPIHHAVRMGNLEVIKILVSAGADVNHATEDGYTPLMVAATIGDIKALELLVSHRANIHARMNDGKTAMNIAKESNNSDIVTWFNDKMGL